MSKAGWLVGIGQNHMNSVSENDTQVNANLTGSGSMFDLNISDIKHFTEGLCSCALIASCSHFCLCISLWQVFGNAPPSSMHEKFSDLLQFTTQVSRLMVTEIRRRASNKSTGVTPCIHTHKTIVFLLYYFFLKTLYFLMFRDVVFNLKSLAAQTVIMLWCNASTDQHYR